MTFSEHTEALRMQNAALQTEILRLKGELAMLREAFARHTRRGIQRVRQPKHR